ncbi:hypothetical protein PJL15_02893 [Paenarthrobacter nitroguajacolicus]|nr:hypothetical protein [Paenarthrobacter nitroguajacolicus]
MNVTAKRYVPGNMGHYGLVHYACIAIANIIWPWAIFTLHTIEMGAVCRVEHL